MLDDGVLTAFMEGFYGYGRYQAPFWFVGMEEGGGNSLAEITRRLEAWESRGRHELEDVAAYHRAIGVDRLFGKRPPLQRTWAQLIRIVLTATGQACDTESVRRYQARALGRTDGDSCLLELLPLPSPSTHRWLYSDLSALPCLTDREAYRREVAPLRIAYLRERLAAHQPKAIVFYGRSYDPYWKQLAPPNQWLAAPEGFAYASDAHTLFVLAHHPTATGMTNHYFQSIGRLIATTGFGSSQGEAS